MEKLILLDLDGTLLHDDKTISDESVSVLKQCQASGMLLGFSTARGESNIQPFLARVEPDIVISSGGALAKYHGETVYACLLSESETCALIEAGRRVTGGSCEITVDTLDGHYWNYKEHPKALDSTWGDVIHTDYADFWQKALKVCIELPSPEAAEEAAAAIEACDYAKFSDGDWYKFTRAGATKEHAIQALGAYLGLLPEEMIAFGDDYGDIEMLRYCGKGIAVANAIPEVRAIADEIAGSNNQDGVARYLADHYL